MAPSALLDLAARAGCIQHRERYSLDCLVRRLLAEGWPLAVALGATGPVEIHAGIGTLRLSQSGQEWLPAAPRPHAVPLPAPPELLTARMVACQACPRWIRGRCEATGCGCSGLGKADNLLSKCPLGSWPSASITPTRP